MELTPSIDLPPKSEKNIRGIVAFPAIESFYNALMDRLHMVMDQFFLKKPFTIFINGIPRDHEVGTKIRQDRFAEDIPLIYGGIERQRQLLEGEESPNIKLNPYWSLLEGKKGLFKKDDAKVSRELFFELRKGDYDLSDIKRIGLGYLKDYFASILYPEKDLKELTDTQKAEFQILKHYFDINTYRYLSVPLIQFAEFDGVVHIILSERDYKNSFVNKNGKLSRRVVGNIIKAFSREYEGLILDWDIVGDAKLKEESFMDAIDPEKLYGEQSNPILKELKYREYYIKYRSYFDNRLNYSKQVPLDLRQQYRQVAIIHILIDSYAHNISAHSLTALEWWFRQRAELHKNASTAAAALHSILNSGNGDPIALLENYNIPIDKEIHPLLRFLLDKGAFWTGLTRDNSFGGRIISLYNVLWRDFINNPLYLGTIAYTEGIAKVNIHITFLKFLGHEGHMRVKKEVELDGAFAQIDLTKFHHYDENENQKKEEQKIERYSDFVVPSKDFDAIAEKLRGYKAFFPGGVVGEHAFFTILETELRNVKHYPPAAMDQIRRDGLTLNISIEEFDYRNADKKVASSETHYYKIGVWLRHPLYIDKQLIRLRPERLYADIIEEESFLPRLGGTYQDKVCAAMLFNNSFASVENKNTERDQRFYPWIKVARSTNLEYKEGDIIEDFEVSSRRLYSPTRSEEFPGSEQYFEANFHAQDGYFKKFFHIWKGENIYAINDIEQLNETWENVSRFRFVYIPSNKSNLFQRVREVGIIRIINEPTTDAAKAFHQWLKKWLKFDNKNIPAYRVEFSWNSNIAAQIDFTDSGVVFRNKAAVELEALSNMQEINLIHNPKQQDDKGNDAARYRSHGIFKEYFCGRSEISVAKMTEDVAAELLEVVATRICIFDNRVASRFKDINTAILTKQLHCTVHSEDEIIWNAEKEKGFCRYNFLVVHLSFVEAIKDENGKKKYDENNIKSFIDQEILDGKEAPENFVLVITTGRGRTHWWDKLKSVQLSQKPGEKIPSYTSFVTFRPVESLTASIENAITLKDDLELKYRLVKVLFGS